jgi:hypothetical protein
MMSVKSRRPEASRASHRSPICGFPTEAATGFFKAVVSALVLLPGENGLPEGRISACNEFAVVKRMIPYLPDFTQGHFAAYPSPENNAGKLTPAAISHSTADMFS